MAQSHRLTRPIVLAALLLAGCSSVDDRAERAAGDISGEDRLAVADMPGPPIGDLAPVDLTLTTADAKPAKPLDFAGRKGLVLMFNRSLDWCPYCQAQVRAMNGLDRAIAAQGYGLTAVTYDPPATLATFAKNQTIGFPLLSDDGSKLIDAFGIRDPQYTEGRAVGVPYASIFILSPDGRVLAKSVSSDYRVRPSQDEVMALLKSANAS